MESIKHFYLRIIACVLITILFQRLDHYKCIKMYLFPQLSLTPVSPELLPALVYPQLVRVQASIHLLYSLKYLQLKYFLLCNTAHSIDHASLKYLPTESNTTPSASTGKDNSINCSL